MSNELLKEKFASYTLVKRLLGGRSNVSYVLEKNNQKYVLRLNDTESIFVNREDEIEGLEAASLLGITSKTYEFTKDYKLSEYLEGEDLSSTSFDYNEVVTVLKKLHDSEGLFSHDFDILSRYSLYESKLKHIDSEYFKYKEFYLDHIKNYEIKKVKCHNDAQDANFIKSNGKLYLIDYEFSGNNDFYFDLASFKVDMKENLPLLDAYLGRAATKEEIRHLVLCRISVCLMWHLVASIKEELGMSEKLQIPFKAVADMFIDTVRELVNTYFC